MKEPPLVVNMDDLAVKRRLVAEIGKLKGLWELHLKPRKLTRTLDQNAYYWAAVVTPFTEWLREEYGDRGISKEQAHDMLRMRILGLEHGALIKRSSHLNTQEFSDYLEKCAAWLAEFCGLVVVPSELFYESKEKKNEGISRRHRPDGAVPVDQASRNRRRVETSA